MKLEHQKKQNWKTKGAVQHILLSTLPKHQCRNCGGTQSLLDIPAYLPVDANAEHVDMTLSFVCGQCRITAPVQLNDLEQIIHGIAKNKRLAGTRGLTETEDQQLIEFLGYYYKRLQREAGIPDLKVIYGGKSSNFKRSHSQ